MSHEPKPAAFGRCRWIVLAVALLIRGGAATARIDSFAADPDAYRAIAEVFARHGIYGRATSAVTAETLATDDAARRTSRQVAPTAYRPPLYPLLLTPFVGDSAEPRTGAVTSRSHSRDTLSARNTTRPRRWSLALLHVILGVATVDMVLRAGRLLGGARSAVGAALATAVDPILVFQSTVVMTETLAAFLAISALLALIRLSRTPTLLRATLAGLAIGLAALCRPTFLPWAPLAALGCLAIPGDWSRRTRLAAALFLATIVVLAPWTVRNKLVFGRWIATTTHGGYTLLLGNNPDFYQFLRTSRAGDVWNPPDGHLMDSIRVIERSERPAAWHEYERMTPTDREVVEDDMAYRFAWRSAATDPAAFVRACLYRTGQFWSPLPHARSANESAAARGLRYVIAAWYLVIGGALIVGAVRLGRKWLSPPWLWTLLLVASFASAHVLYWSNLRMRGPVTPALSLILVAAATQGHRAVGTPLRRSRSRNRR